MPYHGEAAGEQDRDAEDGSERNSDGQSSGKRSRAERDSESERQPAIAKACTVCAKRKTRCSGGKPCTTCVKSGAVCEYKVPQRRGPKVRKGISVDASREASSAQLSQSQGVNGIDAGAAAGLLADLSQAGVANLNNKVQSGPFGDARYYDASRRSLLFDSIIEPPQHTFATSEGVVLGGEADHTVPALLADSLRDATAMNSIQDADSLTFDFSQLLPLPSITDRQPTMQNAPLPQGGLTSPTSAANSVQENVNVSSRVAAVFTVGQPAWPSNPHSPRTSEQAGRTQQTNGDSTFASRLYEGPGVHLNHFSSLLPQSMSIPDGNTPSSSSPRRLLSESSLSPGQSDGSFRPERHRDLQRLAEQPSTLQICYRLYFAFVHSLWPVIYRPLFDPLQAAVSTPALHYAILAIVCRFDVTKQLQQVPNNLKAVPYAAHLGEYYFAKAKAALDLADLASELHNVQALILLALRELAQGRTRQGWFYSGLAIRMAYDMQLHSAAKSSPTAQGCSDAQEQEHRRVIWTCFCLDKSVSLMLGRPSMMRLADIEAPYPSVFESDEYSYWIEDAKLIIPEGSVRYAGVRSHCMTTFIAWIKVMIIVDKVMDTLYRPQKAGGRLGLAQLVELDNALNRWRLESSEVLLHANSLHSAPTHPILVILWHYACRLLIHRPFIPQNPVVQTGDGLKTSHTICTEAAEAVVGMVAALDENFGVYRCPHSVVFIIFQAGIMHLANSTGRDAALSARSRDALHKCIGWLDQIGTAYACSPQYRSVLAQLETMGNKELRDHQQVTEILASRIASRAQSPVNAHLEQTVESTDNNPLGNLHESWWDMPLSLPIDDGDLASWRSWQLDYSSLLSDNVQDYVGLVS